MRRTSTMLPLLALAAILTGCATPSNAALAPTPPPTASVIPTPDAPTPRPTPTPAPTPSPTPTASAPVLTLGYTAEQIAAACIPAVQTQYEGTIVTGASEKDPWLTDGGKTATFEWLTYIPDSVTWTSNTDVTFPALCSITNTDPSAPTVVYVGVADL